MVRINLLPHREAKRKQKQTAFVAMLALGGILGVAVVLLVGGYNASRIAIQNERNLVLKSANADLDKKIAAIATLKQEIEALQARQQAVEDLQGDRNQPVYLMDALVKLTPPGVYLKSFKQDAQRVVINGVAQSNERVADFLRNLGNGSQWLEKPDLVGIRSAPLTQQQQQKGIGGRKVFDFTIGVAIKRARESDAAAKPGAAGAPAAGAPAAGTPAAGAPAAPAKP
jgi:type IV pilus assembly protein PilN